MPSWKDNYDREEYRSINYGIFEQIIPVAEEYKVKIALENMWQVEPKRKYIHPSACGTAAVISPVGKIVDHGREIVYGMDDMGPVTKKLYDTLRGIQLGTVGAPDGWIKVIE